MATFRSLPDAGCVLTLATWQHLDHGAAVQLIDQAFARPRRREDLPIDERRSIDAQRDPISSGYGLCQWPSQYGVLPDEALGTTHFGLSATEHLVDLGAGDGRLSAMAVLAHDAASSLGIELAASRVADGCAALERLALALNTTRQPEHASQPTAAQGHAHADARADVQGTGTAAQPRRTVTLRVGDVFLAAGYGAATRAVVYATCFPAALSASLQSRLVAELPRAIPPQPQPYPYPYPYPYPPPHLSPLTSHLSPLPYRRETSMWFHQTPRTISSAHTLFSTQHTAALSSNCRSCLLVPDTPQTTCDCFGPHTIASHHVWLSYV